MNKEEKELEKLNGKKDSMGNAESAELNDDELDQVNGGIYTKYIYNKKSEEENNGTEKKEI